uniref:dephospho-CoA kinase n=1 Tax=Salmonella enterica TaxID=28901 RepID=UPI00398C5290
GPKVVETHIHLRAIGVRVVELNAEQQVMRRTQRDGVTRAAGEHIVAARATPEASLAEAGDVRDNNGATDAIASDVARLHASYLKFASHLVSHEKPQFTPRPSFASLSLTRCSHGRAHGFRSIITPPTFHVQTILPHLISPSLPEINVRSRHRHTN